MCPYCFLALNMIKRNEIRPNTIVKAILPVTFAVPGIKPKYY
jgi:hypothetical protein